MLGLQLKIIFIIDYFNQLKCHKILKIIPKAKVLFNQQFETTIFNLQQFTVNLHKEKSSPYRSLWMFGDLENQVRFHSF